MRVSKADGSQVLDLQRDALIAAGVKRSHLYEDQASGKKDDRPSLEACLKALREGDTLIVWKLDRRGRQHGHHDRQRPAGVRNFRHARRVRVRADPRENDRGLSSARGRGRNGGRPYMMTPATLSLAEAAM